MLLGMWLCPVQLRTHVGEFGRGESQSYVEHLPFFYCIFVEEVWLRGVIIERGSIFLYSMPSSPGEVKFELALGKGMDEDGVVVQSRQPVT